MKNTNNNQSRAGPLVRLPIILFQLAFLILIFDGVSNLTSDGYLKDALINKTNPTKSSSLGLKNANPLEGYVKYLETVKGERIKLKKFKETFQ